MLCNVSPALSVFSSCAEKPKPASALGIDMPAAAGLGLPERSTEANAAAEVSGKAGPGGGVGHWAEPDGPACVGSTGEPASDDAVGETARRLNASDE